MMGFWLAAGLLLALLLYCIVLFNRLVARRNHAKEAWSGIDVQLKRRHDLLPKLAEVVKAYGRFEQATLQGVTEARSAGAGVARQEAENGLTRGLRHLFALAEAYPDLKANQGYLDLQRQVSETEEQIQYARRYYNGTVRELNVLVESFPSNLVARAFGFRSGEYFEIELATRRESPELKL
ncbi:MAG TPA: LemA family protein [Burkholderiales bacterium]|nr:LemA family protein [Burkholderiales bacterium]